MLKKVEFKNYRCFEKSEIFFRDTSIIVGQNNAGKSTIVEALRILSVVAQKFQKTSYITPPKALNLPLATKGMKVNIDHLKIDLRSVVSQYKERDGVIAEVKAFFDGKIVIHLYMSSEILFATIQADGHLVKSRSDALKIPNIELYIMPQIGLIREDEKRLKTETINENMHTRLSSRHFRNQLLLYKNRFDEFKEVAQKTWPGLRITNLSYEPEDNRIELFVYDSNFAGEIGLMGSGLQMWLQMVWFISRCPKGSMIVLDEPDVYMHPDLQRKILKIVQQKFQQIIIATHSIEIISSVEPKQIVTVDKESRKMKYADDYKAVQNLVDNLGGVNNISLIRLGNARKCVFVEGKDMKLLSKFHKILYPDSQETIEHLPSVELGGWSRFDEALGAARLFYDQTHGEVQTFCILDRDYHSDEEIQKLLNRAQESHLNLHVWAKKELENYILTPQSIFRLTERSHNEYEKFRSELFEEIDKLKEQTLEGYLDQIGQNCRGRNSSTNYRQACAMLDERWQTLESRLSVCNGKDLISLINDWIRQKYKKSASKTKLLEALTPDDICDEMKNVISLLCGK